MLNFVLCDDEESARRQLADYIRRFSAETGEQVRITEFSSGEELLTGYPYDTDILLLDIRMGAPDGMETARRLREFAPDVCIIFIRSLSQYALKSYSVRAFGFLPKPVTYPAFLNEVTQAAERIRRQTSRRVLIRDRERGRLLQMDVKDICYFEVKNHDIYAVTEKRRLFCRGTLNGLERDLACCGFFRCHAAFLVNCQYIASIDQQITLADGTQIPISRSKRKDFLQKLTEYVGALT